MIQKNRNLITTIGLFVLAILIALFVKAYVVQPYVVDGQSMESTLQNNDRLLVNKLPKTFAGLSGHPYVPKRGDIIVFNQSGLPGFDGSKQLIKRVIGLPGDRVVIKDGSIIIINAKNPKGFNPDKVIGYSINSPQTLGNVDVTISRNQIFVCGDNRDHSEDSRYFGPVDISKIVGKLSFRILPISKASHY